ncbi:hypothetical protein Q5692_39710, partial [Microcoleus sp. C2C3]|uniref:hypothetical protein n=1 Tax=Microcoleus sp. C2C3 TaxID=3055324 RepID=UPI002FD546A5
RRTIAALSAGNQSGSLLSNRELSPVEVIARVYSLGALPCPLTRLPSLRFCQGYGFRHGYGRTPKSRLTI